ncbi:MAG TPA: capsule assembly Wzi family protein [Balneolaceae bacterium]|nr:capsule assembly Wzi family protein [Balneolaceae bacterium]
MAQQLPENDIYRDYLQTLTIDGILPQTDNPIYLSNQRFVSFSSLDSLHHPWDKLPPSLLEPYKKDDLCLAPYDLQFHTYWQSLEPGGQHDGPVWQGRGFTTDFSTGFFVKYGPLSASFHPHLLFNQNRSFILSPYDPPSGRSVYAYPLGNIDWPQRFGRQPFWTFDLGNTYLRVDYHGWAAGLSNKLMRWGPGRQNSLLMDSNAPGFRHFFIGTSEPKDIYLGYLKTKLIWGKLLESNYFDQNPKNNERYITGITLSFNPKPLPNLQLGINRIFYETIPPDGIPARDLLQPFEALTKIHFTNNSNLGGNDQADQLISIFGRWTFPKSGLEIYGEWARNDHSWNWRDFITEPEHSRGYTLGLQKTFDLSENRILSINAELTQLEASKTGVFRGYPTFYVHHKAIQGFTNQGQILGASIGPGSSSQYLGGTLFFNRGSIKLFVQRVGLNNDFLYDSNAMLDLNIQNPDRKKYWLHNIEMRLGGSFTYFWKQFETSFGFTFRRELNDYYIYKNDKSHLGLNISIRYRLSPLR